ncbi:hypothetical protein IGI44_004234 [Enterococcus sp. DIV0756]
MILCEMADGYWHLFFFAFNPLGVRSLVTDILLIGVRMANSIDFPFGV